MSNERLNVDEMVIFHETNGPYEELSGNIFTIGKTIECFGCNGPTGQRVCYGQTIYIHGLNMEKYSWCSWTVRKIKSTDSLEDLLVNGW